MKLASTPALTVSELTYKIKNQLEGHFPHLTIQGEISNAKLNSSGHFYFDLKDAEAKISCVMFRSKIGLSLKLPKEGDQVVLKAALSLYPPQGKYQLIVDSLEFQGVGALLLKLEELKNRLKMKGWFEKERKKALPPFPRRIGVVTSPTGSVICDIIHILSRRYKGFHLILNPVKVQGEGAASEIAQAIKQFNQHKLVDVIIVARGGGSLEDLWAFNEEVVATAIYQSSIPIISAVGHETDFTIADFVADLRAPTPSAAAEMVTSEKVAQLQFLQKMEKGTRQALLHNVTRYRTRLEGFRRHPLFKNPYLIVGNVMQKLDELTKKIDQKMKNQTQLHQQKLEGKRRLLLALKPSLKIEHVRKQLTHFSKRLNSGERALLLKKKEKIETLKLQFLSLDPKNVLKRGYSILFCQKNNSVIVSAETLSVGDEVTALLAEGKLELQITQAIPNS